MGEIHSNVTLENTEDRAVVNRGHGQEADVRRATIDGIVDTGAVTLVLPQNVVERLGLEQQGTAFVTYADERREERPLAGPVNVRIGNRGMVTNCVVGPPRIERDPEIMSGAWCFEGTRVPDLRGVHEPSVRIEHTGIHGTISKR